MILKEEIEIMLKEAPQMQGIIFKRALKPHHNDNEILNSFEKIIANKPAGFWLMRESRVAGKISVTYRTESGVFNKRFAFTNGEWKTAYSNDEFEPLDRKMIGTQCQQLIKCLTFMDFNIDKIVLPGNDEQSTNELYSGYNYVTVGESRIRYDDPIASLNTVIDKLKKIIRKKELHQLNFATELHHVKTEDLFCEWLNKNRLNDGILDPIYYTLMKNPYIISESGYAFDFTTLFDDNFSLRLEKCPLTRKPIILKPYRVEGYTIKLAECIKLFETLIKNTIQLRQIISIDDNKTQESKIKDAEIKNSDERMYDSIGSLNTSSFFANESRLEIDKNSTKTEENYTDSSIFK